MSNNNSALAQVRLSAEDSDAFEDALISAYSKKAAAMRRGETDLLGRPTEHGAHEEAHGRNGGAKREARHQVKPSACAEAGQNEVHGAHPTTFDPRAARVSSWRRKLIAAGALIPLADRPTLRLDARGRRVAERHAEAGSRGAAIVPTPPGYFELPAWHVQALELQAFRRRHPSHARMMEIAREQMREWDQVIRELAGVMTPSPRPTPNRLNSCGQGSP